MTTILGHDVDLELLGRTFVVVLLILLFIAASDAFGGVINISQLISLILAGATVVMAAEVKNQAKLQNKHLENFEPSIEIFDEPLSALEFEDLEFMGKIRISLIVTNTSQTSVVIRDIESDDLSIKEWEIEAESISHHNDTKNDDAFRGTIALSPSETVRLSYTVEEVSSNDLIDSLAKIKKKGQINLKLEGNFGYEEFEAKLVENVDELEPVPLDRIDEYYENLKREEAKTSN